MNMVYGFGNFLTRRKQAYMGKPASAIRYDPVKGRYVIDGESESEEEEKAPPPKMNKKKEESKEEPAAKPKEEVKEATGANALMGAFGGSLGGAKRRAAAKKGGARPGAGAAKRPGMPAAPLGGAPSVEKVPEKEEEVKEIKTEPTQAPVMQTEPSTGVNDTTMNDTMNNSTYRSAIEDSLDQTTITARTANDSFSTMRNQVNRDNDRSF